MAITDTETRYWDIIAASNLPTGGSFINRDLPRQWRNIKSNVRIESLDKEFEKRKEQPVTVVHSGGGVASMAFAVSLGNLTSIFTVKRKLRFTPVAGGTPTYCAVTSSVFTTSTAVVLAEMSGALATGGAYVIDVGIDDPTFPSLPGFTQSGSITIADAASSGVASFGRGEPWNDLDYFARATVLSVVGVPTGGQALVTGITKGLTSMVIVLGAAPGVGNSTVLGWTIMRET